MRRLLARNGRFYGGVMPGAELVLFEGAGHLLTITRSSEVSAAIHTFIERSL